MKRILGILIALCFLATPVFADPGKAKGHAKEDSPAERITNETADAIADALTDTDTSKKNSTASLPPGLAKKDQTPPGWEKGNKTGWDKNDKPAEDSLIQKFIKGLFNKS